jgi:hypothetical protein
LKASLRRIARTNGVGPRNKAARAQRRLSLNSRSLLALIVTLGYFENHHAIRPLLVKFKHT